MPRQLKQTRQFKKDKKRIKGSGRYHWSQLLELVEQIMSDQLLAEKYRDHDLLGEYQGVRECHISPDWLLIYDKTGDVDTGELILIRTGSHSELFG